jgi:branched-chain amino acid transport system permease protein
LADEIFVLANGQLLATGTPEEIAAHPGVLEEYLGVHAIAAEDLPTAVRSSDEGAG